MFVQQFVQIANKEISTLRVTVPWWWESTVVGGSPHKRRVTWKMLLFDDVIMDWRIPWRHMCHITQYTRYITAFNQTMLQCSREVGMLASRWFLCYRWDRFFTITPSVKSNVTTTLLGVEGGHPRWQKDLLKVLQGKLLKFSPDSNQIWCAHWVWV